MIFLNIETVPDIESLASAGMVLSKSAGIITLSAQEMLTHRRHIPLSLSLTSSVTMETATGSRHRWRYISQSPGDRDSSTAVSHAGWHGQAGLSLLPFVIIVVFHLHGSLSLSLVLATRLDTLTAVFHEFLKQENNGLLHVSYFNVSQDNLIGWMVVSKT